MVTGTLILLSVPSLCFAQNNSNVENRLSRIENEIETLGRAVYRGETPPAGAPRFTASTSGEEAGEMQVRLNQLESQLRDLTGRLEQAEFEKRQVTERLNDLEMMLQAQQAAPPQPQVQPRANTPGFAPMTPSTPEDSDSSDGAANMIEQSMQAEESQTGMKTVRPLPSDDAASQYEQAFAFIKSGDYGAAESAFTNFLAAHENHALSPNAMYWLAESYYVQDKFDLAAKAFAEAYQKFPGGPKGADNLLKLGMSLAALNKTEEACIAYGQLAREYPAGPTTILRRGEQEQDRLNCR